MSIYVHFISDLLMYYIIIYLAYFVNLKSYSLIYFY